MTLDESHGAIQLIEKVATEARSLLFVPHDGIINFALGQVEETDLHGSRCLAITSS